MTNLFIRYATPLITGLFLVSLISGIALFLHIGPAGFHGMHEWLSMVLILPFALHLWKNWKPMLAYFRRAPMGVALVLSTVAALAFLVPLNGAKGAAGGPPQFQLAHRVMSQSLTDVAPALGATPQAITLRLTAAGFTVADGQTLTEIAAASGKSEGDLAAALLGVGS
jgi:hypothetical protein